MIYDQEAYKSVNYKKVYSKANEYLALAPSITGFPFKAKGFVYEQSDIKLCTFKKASQIVTPNGRTVTFSEHGVVSTGTVPNLIDETLKQAYLELWR